VHFADAARAFILASEKQPANGIMNIVDGSAVSFGTFIDTFAQALGRKKPRRTAAMIQPCPLFCLPCIPVTPPALIETAITLNC
jgi:nucleoside-diphosphate-sugar epimerase